MISLMSKQRVATSDNSVAEGVLGKQGITCAFEDPINEIYTAGLSLKQAAKFSRLANEACRLKGRVRSKTASLQRERRGR